MVLEVDAARAKDATGRSDTARGRRFVALTTMLLAIFVVTGEGQAETVPRPELLRIETGHRARLPRSPRPPRPPRRCHNDRPCRGGECNDAGMCCRRDQITCGGVCCDKLFADACCDGKCVNFALDNKNCGGCGIECRDDMTCQDGVCSCLATETDCGTKCANLMLDEDNCGTCGHACDADLECSFGTCRCKGLTEDLCDGQCVDLKTSAQNCGWCGNACLAGQECVNGGCQEPCGPCAVRDPSGTCVAKCPQGQICGDDGECTTDCGPFATLCGGRCVSKTPRGWGVCCEFDGDWHACATGEQCAGYGCCDGGAQVCPDPNGAAQCCYGGFLCVHRGDGSAACCLPGNHNPQDCGPGGLPDYCCLPH